MRTIKPVLASAVSALALVVSGCAPSGTSASQGVATTTTSTTSSPMTTSTVVTTTTTPTAGVGPSGGFTVTVTDKDGYAFDVSVRVATTSLGDTVEFDKPGFMSTNFKLSLSMQVINKTAGRALTFEPVSGITKPLGNPKFLVSALWEKGSPVCTASSITKGPCALLLGFGYLPASVPPGATVALDVKKGHPSGWFTAGLAGFPESSWPEVKPALAAPTRFLISYDGGGHTRFGCSLHMRLGIAVAVSGGAFDCKKFTVDQVQQPKS
jgi:hypothetical protein